MMDIRIPQRDFFLVPPLRVLRPILSKKWNTFLTTKPILLLNMSLDRAYQDFFLRNNLIGGTLSQDPRTDFLKFKSHVFLMIFSLF